MRLPSVCTKSGPISVLSPDSRRMLLVSFEIHREGRMSKYSRYSDQERDRPSGHLVEVRARWDALFDDDCTRTPDSFVQQAVHTLTSVSRDFDKLFSESGTSATPGKLYL